MTADVLHPGLVNLIRRARALGTVTVGLLTDEAVAGHKRLPFLTWHQRRELLENVVGVDRVVPQAEWDYSHNVLRYRPDFFVHGDDWISGPDEVIRDAVVAALATYGGHLVEIEYMRGFSASAMTMHALEVASTPEIRISALRRSLASQPITRIMQVHSPLAAMMVEATRVDRGPVARMFDGFWSSSLADSANLGLPDNELLDASVRLDNVERILAVTTRPLIFDADTGGAIDHFEHRVRAMERLGVAAVVIEDKRGLKYNSLVVDTATHVQEDIHAFCDKIAAGKSAQQGLHFQVFARLESLIVGAGMEDAVERAVAYCKAGADGLLIHSRQREPDEILRFAGEVRDELPSIPLICVPTTYHEVRDDELADAGFRMVIYANHLLRASLPAMERVARSILEHGRSTEIEHELLSVDQTLEIARPLGG